MTYVCMSWNAKQIQISTIATHGNNLVAIHVYVVLAGPVYWGVLSLDNC